MSVLRAWVVSLIWIAALLGETAAFGYPRMAVSMNRVFGLL